MQNKTKVLKNVNWTAIFRLLKWIVPAAIVFTLFNKFYKNDDINAADFLFKLKNLDPILIVALLLFSLINWGIEIRKWQYLICKLELQSFKIAAQSVFAGLAVSQLMPYRTGEYIGRLAFVKDENKINAGILSVLGSFSQLIITLLFGLPAFIYLFINQLDSSSTLALISAALLPLIIFFAIKNVQIFRKNVLFLRLQDAWNLLKPNDVFRLIGFSALRYLFFITPYVMLTIYFELNVYEAWYTMFVAVASIFFLQSVSPNFILTDIAIRVSVPALVFSTQLGIESPLVFLPGLIIYFFNLLIPMCIGALMFLFIQFKK